MADTPFLAAKNRADFTLLSADIIRLGLDKEVFQTVNRSNIKIMENGVLAVVSLKAPGWGSVVSVCIDEKEVSYTRLIRVSSVLMNRAVLDGINQEISRRRVDVGGRRESAFLLRKYTSI